MTQQTAKLIAAGDPGRRPKRRSRLSEFRSRASRFSEPVALGLTDMEPSASVAPAAFSEYATKQLVAQLTAFHDAVKRPVERGCNRGRLQSLRLIRCVEL